MVFLCFSVINVISLVFLKKKCTSLLFYSSPDSFINRAAEIIAEYKLADSFDWKYEAAVADTLRSKMDEMIAAAEMRGWQKPQPVKASVGGSSVAPVDWSTLLHPIRHDETAEEREARERAEKIQEQNVLEQMAKRRQREVDRST